MLHYDGMAITKKGQVSPPFHIHLVNTNLEAISHAAIDKAT